MEDLSMQAMALPTRMSHRPPAPTPAHPYTHTHTHTTTPSAHAQGHNDGDGDEAILEGEGESEGEVDFQAELEHVRRGLMETEINKHPLVADIHYKTQLIAARKLRQLLSTNRELLIQEILERNWVPSLLNWLQLNDKPQVQVEALWALTNIAAGTSEHTQVLIRHGAIPILVSLLSSDNDEVLEQSVWVLGNLAGEGAVSRDAVLGAGVLKPLVKCLERRPHSLSLVRIGSWALSNFCDGQPRPVIDVSVIISTLASLLHHADSEVLSHTCWALSHLCDGPSAHIKAVVEANVCDRLVALLSHRSCRVTKPALRTVGNIVCAEDDIDYTQYVIDAGAVLWLRQLIAHQNREIQKEACWTLSNIAAGTVDQIQEVLDCGAIPYLVQLATRPETDPEVKSEACWVVLNATSCGSDLQIEYLVHHGCVAVLGDLLSESSMVMMALEGLERILQVGDMEAKRVAGGNPYASLLASGRIEALENHKSTAISKRAARIWKQFYVTCAICNKSYSKHSPDAFFCAECKCHVCKCCDCTVFHLSYQEEFWKQVSQKEASVKEAQRESKKLKKQKKKLKEREKKKAHQTVVQPQGAKGGTSPKNGAQTHTSGSDSSPPPFANGAPDTRARPFQTSSEEGEVEDFYIFNSKTMNQHRHVGSNGSQAQPLPLNGTQSLQLDWSMTYARMTPSAPDVMPACGNRNGTGSADLMASKMRRKKQSEVAPTVSTSVQDINLVPSLSPPLVLNGNPQDSEDHYTVPTDHVPGRRKHSRKLETTHSQARTYTQDHTIEQHNRGEASMPLRFQAREPSNVPGNLRPFDTEGVQETKSVPIRIQTHPNNPNSHSHTHTHKRQSVRTDECNDELVDFLQETGSILALAAKLDLEEYDG